jgi:hypothetical protein
MPIRVTEVLSFFKEQWYIDWVHRVGRTEANKISKASMKVGSRVDELIKTDSVPTNKDSVEVVTAFNAYGKWKAVYQPKSIIPGTRLFATIEGVEVTGEPDIFVDDVLVDIKCSSKISPSYWVQVNMYKYLKHIEHADIAVSPNVFKYNGKVGILRLDKTTGSYEYVVRDYEPHLVDVWCGLLKAMVYFKGEEDNGDEL